MSDEVIEMIVTYTNLYAAQNNAPSLLVTIEEVYCVLRVLYLSGYIPLPRKPMYWEQSDDVHDILVSKSIRRNRFNDILRYFHLCDNTDLSRGEPGDKMAKIRGFIEIMNRNFLLNAPNETNLSVDESMIPYFGRHGCRQFIKGKPIRFGYKAWTMAQKHGYCLQADIYQGKGSDSRPKGVTLGEKVVLDFCDIVCKAQCAF